MDRNQVMTDPKKLIRIELRNHGIDIDKVKIPKRVYMLADSLFDEIINRDVGEYKYPLGGALYVFKNNDDTFIAVYCTGKDFKGEGHVEVSVPVGKPEDYLLRITGMVNIALA